MKVRIHNAMLIAASYVATALCVAGAMGLDGEGAGVCFAGLVIGLAWLGMFIYANKERFLHEHK